MNTQTKGWNRLPQDKARHLVNVINKTIDYMADQSLLELIFDSKMVLCYKRAAILLLKKEYLMPYNQIAELLYLSEMNSKTLVYEAEKSRRNSITFNLLYEELKEKVKNNL